MKEIHVWTIIDSFFLSLVRFTNNEEKIIFSNNAYYIFIIKPIFVPPFSRTYVTLFAVQAQLLRRINCTIPGNTTVSICDGGQITLKFRQLALLLQALLSLLMLNSCVSAKCTHPSHFWLTLCNTKTEYRKNQYQSVRGWT